jgi:hypothetical protein
MRVHPPSFYAAAFLISFLLAQVFWPAYQLLSSLIKLIAVTS